MIILSGCTKLGAHRLGVSSVFELLGEGGLTPLYVVLDETLRMAGSRGRLDIGGSPRGRAVTESETRQVFEAINKFLNGGK
jgi:hypothetical protein